jgi:Fe-S cluster assembly protein SufB
MSAAFSFKQDFLEQPANVPTKYVANFGLSEDIVRQISASKSEPTWMLEKRLAALRTFFSLSMPSWGPSLAGLDIAKIRYFVQPDTQEAARWEDVPTEIRETFDLLGIPEAERAGLGGVGAQFDSEVIYHNLQKSLQERGVIFLNMDEALRRHEDLVREYFMTRCVPTHDHIFAALHAAVWSGGTFIFVPRDVRVEVPLQAYFRMNAAWGGQFEHTLIIVEDGARLEYIEGCSAPKFDSAALHAGCVESCSGLRGVRQAAFELLLCPGARFIAMSRHLVLEGVHVDRRSALFCNLLRELDRKTVGGKQHERIMS